LRVERELMLLVRREPCVGGQRRRRPCLFEEAHVLGADARTRVYLRQCLRPQTDGIEHERQALVRFGEIEADVEMIVLVALPRIDAAAVAGNDGHRAPSYSTTSIRWGPRAESARASPSRRDSMESARRAGTPMPPASCTQSGAGRDKSVSESACGPGSGTPARAGSSCGRR